MSTCLLNDDPFWGQPGAVTETYDVWRLESNTRITA